MYPYRMSPAKDLQAKYVGYWDKARGDQKYPKLEPSTVAEYFRWMIGNAHCMWAGLEGAVRLSELTGSEDDRSNWVQTEAVGFEDSIMVGNGFLLARVYSGSREGEVLVYRWFTCKHDFVSRNVGRCLNNYTCKHCGFTYQVDSSD